MFYDKSSNSQFIAIEVKQYFFREFPFQLVRWKRDKNGCLKSEEDVWSVKRLDGMNLWRRKVCTDTDKSSFCGKNGRNEGRWFCTSIRNEKWKMRTIFKVLTYGTSLNVEILLQSDIFISRRRKKKISWNARLDYNNFVSFTLNASRFKRSAIIGFMIASTSKILLASLRKSNCSR